MKYLLPLAFIVLAGCQTPYYSKSSRIKYTKLTVTDASGEPVAEWVAEGRVRKSEQGFDIQAVERQTPPPNPLTLHYPNRRAATVVGPNIVLEKIDKPGWLEQLDGLDGLKK